MTVSPVLQRTAIRLSISSRIFLRFCWIFAESSLLAGCFVLGNKVFIAVATSNRIWETALLCMGELTSTRQTNRELYTGFVFTGLTGAQMAMMDSEIDKRMMMKVTVHEQSAHCLFFILIQHIFFTSNLSANTDFIQRRSFYSPIELTFLVSKGLLCLYDKQNNTWFLADMKFLLCFSTQHFFHLLYSFVSY